MRLKSRLPAKVVVAGGLAGEAQEVPMTGALVEKLLKSFDDLDRCITVTKQVLAAKSSVPDDVLARVNQYSEIVIKQRELATSLRMHLSEENWSEVTRHVRLINGLSSMIRDDAQAILAGAMNTPSVVKNEHLA